MVVSSDNGTDGSHIASNTGVQKSAVLHRHLHHEFPVLVRGEGNYLFLKDGRKIFDASGGAAVACVGVSVPSSSLPMRVPGPICGTLASY